MGEETGTGLSRRHLLAIGGAGVAGTVVAPGITGEEIAVAAALDARDFGVRADGTTDDTAAMNAAIAALNTKPQQELVLPEGTIKITAELNPITQNDVTIRGAGPGTTTIRFPSTAGAAGTFFTIGRDGAPAHRVNVERLRLQCVNTGPAATAPAIKVQNANDLRVSHLQLDGISALTKIGTDASACSRAWFRNISGSYNAARGAKVIWLHNAKTARFVDIQVTSSAAPSAGGASVYVRPVAAGSFIDTAYFIRCAIWSAGQDHGVDIDATEQKVVWLWFLDCVFDDCKVDAFRIRSTGKEVRNVLVRGCLLGATADAGSNCVDISHSGADANADVLTGVSFEDCLMAYRAGPAVLAAGSTVRDLKLYFNRVQDSTATAKNAAFSFSCGNWTAIGNRFYRYAGASGTAHAIETTADVDNFVAIGNLASHLTTDFFSHFAYSSPSADRIVGDNTGGAAASGGAPPAGGSGGTGGSAETYKTRSLSANSDYVPDQTRRTQVIVTPKLTVPAGAHGAVLVQVGNPGATTEVARVEFDNDDPIHKVVTKAPVSVVVPPGQAYRLTTQNVTGSSGFELGAAQELPL